MSKVVDRPSIYMNTKLAQVRARAQHAGETLSGELTHLAHRYDMALSLVAPELPAEELTVLRRIFAYHPRLPAVLIRPKTVAGMIEDAANNERGDEATLRLVFSLARRVARMSAIECLAIVEATERWVRRPTSREEDRVSSSFTRPSLERARLA